MPLYEYECLVCTKRFEKIQRVGATPTSECPSCGGAVRRLLGVPALQFKGSGWYVTDYGKGNGNGAGSRERNGESNGTGASEKNTTKDATNSASSEDSSSKDSAVKKETNSKPAKAS